MAAPASGRAPAAAAGAPADATTAFSDALAGAAAEQTPADDGASASVEPKKDTLEKEAPGKEALGRAAKDKKDKKAPAQPDALALSTPLPAPDMPGILPFLVPSLMIAAVSEPAGSSGDDGQSLSALPATAPLPAGNAQFPNGDAQLLADSTQRFTSAPAFLTTPRAAMSRYATGVPAGQGGETQFDTDPLPVSAPATTAAAETEVVQELPVTTGDAATDPAASSGPATTNSPALTSVADGLTPPAQPPITVPSGFRVELTSGRSPAPPAPGVQFGLRLNPQTGPISVSGTRPSSAPTPGQLAEPTAAEPMPAATAAAGLPVSQALPATEHDADPPAEPASGADNAQRIEGGASTNSASAPSTAQAVQQPAAPDDRQNERDQRQDTSHAPTPSLSAKPDEKAKEEGQRVESAGSSIPAANTVAVPVAARTDHQASPIHTPAAAPGTPAAPVAPAEEIQRPAAAKPREISMSISSSTDQKVEVRLVERAGEVHVSLRTPDETLAHSMRDDLGSLTGKLADSGYGAESYAPVHNGSSFLSDHRGAEPQNSESGRQPGSQQNGGQQQSRQDGRQRRPATQDAFEEALSQNLSNRSNTWLFNR